MADLNIDETRKLANAAKDGPWEIAGDFRSGVDYIPIKATGGTVARIPFRLDSDLHAVAATARFIAHARTALPEALDEIERLRKGHVCTARCKPNAHVAFTGRRRLDDAEAEVGRLCAELDKESRAHTETIGDRDQCHEMADQLADAIARLTGVDIGEHGSMNDPWQNALQAATEAAEAVSRG